MEKENINPKLATALEIFHKNRLESLESYEKNKEHIFSDKFEKKMHSIIKTHKRPFFGAVKTPKRRAAVLAFVIAIAMSASLLSVKAFRNSNFTLKIYDTFSRLIFDKNSADSPEITKIEHYYKPQYIPEGYELESEVKEEHFFRCSYINEDGKDLTYIQSIISLSGSSIDTEGTTTRDIYVNGHGGIFFSNKGYNSIIWADGVYEYFISTVVDISEDELFKIAESLK